MQAFDLRPYKGKRVTISYDRNTGFESHLLAERWTAERRTAERTLKAPALKSAGKNLLWPIIHGARRETIRLYVGKGL